MSEKGGEGTLTRPTNKTEEWLLERGSNALPADKVTGDEGQGHQIRPKDLVK